MLPKCQMLWPSVIFYWIEKNDEIAFENVVYQGGSHLITMCQRNQNISRYCHIRCPAMTNAYTLQIGIQCKRSEVKK